METLLSKLTDLAYEFFGVILPGFFFLVLLVLLWISAGPTLSSMTDAWIPHLTLAGVGEWESRMSAVRRTEMGVLLVVLCYFLGQTLNWRSREKDKKQKGKAPEGKTEGKAPRFSPLFFGFQRETKRYYDSLEGHYKAVCRAIWPGDETINWYQFYPVAKSAVAQSLDYSLIQTYQHKYTLHRCVAASGATVFWGCVAVTALGVVCELSGGAEPRWALVGVLTLASAGLAHLFARSYNYYWQMWGNTVVTEAFTLYCTPRIEKTREAKK